MPCDGEEMMQCKGPVKDFQRLSMHKNRHQAQISSKYQHLFGT